jgi:hypothetical protein
VGNLEEVGPGLPGIECEVEHITDRVGKPLLPCEDLALGRFLYVPVGDDRTKKRVQQLEILIYPAIEDLDIVSCVLDVQVDVR